VAAVPRRAAHAPFGGPPHLRPATAGTTLVELIIGLSIAVLLLSAAMTSVASHQAQRRMHGERILAMSACRSTLELLRSVPISQLPTFDGRGFDVPGQNGQPLGLPPLAGAPDGLPGVISVVTHPDSAVNNELYIVETRVRWTGATRGGDFRMETLMGERR